jgi:hypothetical protein
VTLEPEPENEPKGRSLAPLAYGLVGLIAVIAAIVALTSGGDEDSPTATTDPLAAPGSTAPDGSPGATNAPDGTQAPGGTAPAPIAGTTPPTEAPAPGATLPPTQVEVDRNPLNGEPLGDGSTNRVIAVKVDHVGDARPQLGLLEAEMIIETPVEGGLTRFTALYFDSRPRGVGPVRSVRPVDADLLAAFRPILISTGGKDFVYRDLRAAGIELVDRTTPELFQQIERIAPHNLVATVGLVAQELDPGAPRVQVFPFGDQPLGGDPVGSVRIPFSGSMDVEWRYDGERYVRYENGAEFVTMVDAGLETVSLTTDTVLVLSVAQRSAGYVDSAGADVPTFDVIGFGGFMAFSQGAMVTGEWRRAAQGDGYFLIGSDGTLVTLPVGRVFVEIVPRSIEVTTAARAS